MVAWNYYLCILKFYLHDFCDIYICFYALYVACLWFLFLIHLFVKIKALLGLCYMLPYSTINKSSVLFSSVQSVFRYIYLCIIGDYCIQVAFSKVTTVQLISPWKEIRNWKCWSKAQRNLNSIKKRPNPEILPNILDPHLPHLLTVYMYDRGTGDVRYIIMSITDNY